MDAQYAWHNDLDHQRWHYVEKVRMVWRELVKNENRRNDGQKDDGDAGHYGSRPQRCAQTACLETGHVLVIY